MKCTRCPLHKSAKSNCLGGKGPLDAELLIIGEAPGEKEDEQGKCFVGSAGKILDEFLEDAGLERKNIRITNAVRCKPPSNRTPTKSEISTCRHWLDKEIERVNPKYIITLGNVPTQSVLGRSGITKLRGQIFDGKRTIMPTFHPAAVLYDPRKEAKIIADLNNFVDHIEGDRRGYPGLNCRIVHDVNTLEWKEAVADIKRTNTISFDTETSGLNQFENGFHAVSVGIGTKNNQWCFPLQHTKGILFNYPHKQRRLVNRLDKLIAGKQLTAHNGKFDYKSMKRCFDVDWHCNYDTLLASYHIDENTPHSLDWLAHKYFRAPSYDIPLSDKHGTTGTLERHCEYLAKDLYWTRKLAFKLNPLLTTDSKRLFKHISMKMSRLYAKSEMHGIWMDKKLLAEYTKEYKQKISCTLAQLDKIAARHGVKDINWDSPIQVAELFFDKMKLPQLKKTPTGRSSTDKMVLDDLAENHKVAKLLLDYRDAAKMLGTYLEPWKEKIVDHRLHYSFLIHGTVTGRPSCEKPNVQNIPVRGENKKIRKLFSAPKGYTLISADLSQIELRLAAIRSGDRTMLNAYKNNQDIHSLTVQRIFNKKTVTPEDRQSAKAINFGFLYGMYEQTFIIRTKIDFGIKFTEPQAKKIRKGYFNAYPGLAAWHGKEIAFAREHGYVVSFLGRLRRLPDAMLNDYSKAAKHAERQAINSPIQSTASDINLLAAIELDNRFGLFDWFNIVITVHDEILVEVRNDKVNMVAKAMIDIMQKPKALKKVFGVEFPIPIIAEAGIGPWKHGKEWQADD